MSMIGKLPAAVTTAIGISALVVVLQVQCCAAARGAGGAGHCTQSRYRKPAAKPGRGQTRRRQSRRFYNQGAQGKGRNKKKQNKAKQRGQPLPSGSSDDSASSLSASRTLSLTAAIAMMGLISYSYLSGYTELETNAVEKLEILDVKIQKAVANATETGKGLKDELTFSDMMTQIMDPNYNPAEGDPTDPSYLHHMHLHFCPQFQPVLKHFSPEEIQTIPELARECKMATVETLREILTKMGATKDQLKSEIRKKEMRKQELAASEAAARNNSRQQRPYMEKNNRSHKRGRGGKK